MQIRPRINPNIIKKLKSIEKPRREFITEILVTEIDHSAQKAWHFKEGYLDLIDRYYQK